MPPPINPDNLVQLQTASPNAETPLFLVLEGGGAKAVAHIAAWSFLQDRTRRPGPCDLDASSRTVSATSPRYLLTEVAGTSAGAIAAALIAAGANADQLMDDRAMMPLASELGIERFYDLFGIIGWRRLRFWRGILAPSDSLQRIARRYARPPIHKRLADWRTQAKREKRQRAYRPAVATVVAGVILLMAFGLLGGLIDLVLDSRSEAAALFLCFTVIAAGLLTCAHIAAQWLDNRGIRTRKRHIGSLPRTLTNPVIVLLVALSTVPLIHFFTPLSGLLNILKATFPTPVGLVLVYYAYSFCFLVSLFAIVWFIRSLLKGAVRTRNLQRDMNQALVTILTRECAFDAETEPQYTWTDRKPRNDKERAFLDRIKGAGYHVTFGDLKEVSGCNLSIVTAETIESDVRVYSTATHEKLSVAWAVAASAALPLAFQPIRTARRVLVDGGIISTIPAWLFRRHEAWNPDAKTLAIGIAATGYERWIPRFLLARRLYDNYRFSRGGSRFFTRVGIFLTEPIASLLWPLRFVANVAYTITYGGRSLHLEASNSLEFVELKTSLHLLDFDKPRPLMRTELGKLKGRAGFWIAEKMWNRQENFEKVCSDIAADLQSFCEDQEFSREEGRIRIAWAEPEPRVSLLRVRRVYGYDRYELGERMMLPFDASLAGWSATTGNCYFADDDIRKAMFAGPRNRFWRLLRWQDMRWYWTVPVSKKGRPSEILGVLSVQCNCDIEKFGAILARESKVRALQWKDKVTGKVRHDPQTGVLAEPYPIQGDTSLMITLEKRWVSEFHSGFLDLFAQLDEEDD